MDAEEIVGALAAKEQPTCREGGRGRCMLCGARLLDGADHESDCPWFLAREWVAEQDPPTPPPPPDWEWNRWSRQG